MYKKSTEGKRFFKRSISTGRSFEIVPYLVPKEIAFLISEARNSRNGERDSLFILVLFETGLRVSEALSLTPNKIESFEGKPVLRITGKGGRPRVVAFPRILADKLQAYIEKKYITSDQRIFSFNRQRGWQILKEVSKRAGFTKRVYPHLLRHSDAIERLRQTGNPKALQDHLGHSSIMMVMRYLSTLTKEDSLRIQQQVDFNDVEEGSKS